MVNVPLFYGVLYIPGGCLGFLTCQLVQDFWTINSSTIQASEIQPPPKLLRISTGGWTWHAVDQWTRSIHLSNENRNPGCLGGIRDSSHIGIIISHDKDPYKPTSFFMESNKGLFRGSPVGQTSKKIWGHNCWRMAFGQRIPGWFWLVPSRICSWDRRIPTDHRFCKLPVIRRYPGLYGSVWVGSISVGDFLDW